MICLITAILSPTLMLAGAGTSAPLTAVAITAEAGYNGYIKAGTWIPVRVTLTSSEATDGEVALSPTPDRSQRFGVDVTLARNASKKLLLYSPPAANPIEALFISNGQVVGANTPPIHTLGEGDRLVLVVSNPADGLNFLNDLRTPFGGMTYVAQVQPAQIPDHSAALDSADVLILNNVDTLSFSEAQREAIRVWVLGGGHLILSGGPGARLTAGGFEDFTPAHVGATLQNGSVARLRDLLAPNSVEASADLSGTASISPTLLRPQDLIAPLVTLVPATGDAHSLVGSNEAPLIMRRQIGRGTVDQLAFDPALSPIHDWPDERLVFAGLLGGDLSATSVIGPLQTPSAAINAARALPGAALPSVLVIAAYLALYVLAIGPFNFYVLRKLRRLSWAWVTIPATVILFAAAGYATGFRLHGNEPQVQRLSIISGDVQVAAARAQAIVGVFSPRRTTVDVATGHQLASEIQPNINLQNTASFRLSDPNQFQKVVAINTDVRAFYLQGESSLPRIGADLQFLPGATISEPARISGEITNESGSVLNDCVLIVGKDYNAIGNLDPGAHANVQVRLVLNRPQLAMMIAPSKLETTGYVSSLGTSAGYGTASSSFPASARFPFDMGGATLAEIMLNWRDFGKNSLTELAERGLITAIYSDPATSAGSGANLACWESNDRVGAAVAGADYIDHGLRIWHLPVRTFLARPGAALPADLFTLDIVSSSSTVSLDANGLTLQPGDHILSMTPWVSTRAGGKVDVALSVATDSNSSASALQASSISLFDWSALKFTEVITSMAVSPLAVNVQGAYMSPAGDMRVRLNVRNDDVILTNLQAAAIVR